MPGSSFAPAPPRKLFGAFCALAGAACWGGSNPFGKLVMDQGVAPLEAAGLLYAGAALGLAILRIARVLIAPASATAARARGRVPVERSDLKWILAAAVVGGGVAPFLMMYGLKHTSGLATALLIAVEPPATAFIAVAMFGERLTRRLVLGGLAVLAGAVLVGVLQPGDDGAVGTTKLGALAVAGACTLWGLDSNLSARVARLDATFVAMTKGLLAGPLVLLLAAGLRGAPFWRFWTLAQVAQLLAVGFVGYGLGLALMVRAFRELGAARTGALFASTSLFAALSAVIVLGERPTLPLLGAAAIVGIGVGTIVTEKH